MNNEECHTHRKYHRIIANLYKKPMMNAIEHASSPKMANPREKGTADAEDRGNTVESS